MERTTNDHTQAILSDLPADALEPMTPYMPQIVVNMDDLYGSKSKADYLSRMAQVRKHVDKQLAEHSIKDGYGDIGFTKSYAFTPRAKEANFWPVTMAAILVQDPAKAALTNAALIAETCIDLGVKLLDKACMSLPLSKKQHVTVSTLLANHGFPNAKFKTMTQVKMLVRLAGQNVSTVEVRRTIESDQRHVVLDGKRYKLESRRSKAKGNALHDQCIRVQGSYVPLSAIVELLGLKDTQAAALFSHAPA